MTISTAIGEFDRTKYCTATGAADIIGLNNKNTNWIREQLDKLNIKPVSAYLHAAGPQALYSKAQVEAVALSRQAAKAALNRAPSPPPVMESTPAQPVQLTASIERLEKIAHRLAAAHDVQLDLAPVIERLDKVLMRQTAAAQAMPQPVDLRPLLDGLASLHEQMAEISKGMHVVVEICNGILNTVTEPKS